MLAKGRCLISQEGSPASDCLVALKSSHATALPPQLLRAREAISGCSSESLPASECVCVSVHICTSVYIHACACV